MQILTSFPGFEIFVSERSDGDFLDPSIRRDILRPEKQPHGAEVHTLTRENLHFPFRDVDGIYTNETSVIIAALCADCPIIVLMGKGESLVVHSGWRGTKLSILSHAIAKMQTPRQEIFVYIGPHIQRDSYAVGAEFFEYFGEKYVTQRENRYFFDIGERIFDTLCDLGIQRENIIMSAIDTFTDEKYHSYRRDGKASGRGIVGVKMGQN